MAERRPAQRATVESTGGFSKEERAAMRERAREVRARSRAGKGDGESEVLAKISSMASSDRTMSERIHALIKAHAPALSPKTWYGMPAYANRDGEVVCFFRDAQKFKTRYATLGFSDEAKLDEGHMWPTDFALTELTAVEEAKIVALLRRAVGGV